MSKFKFNNLPRIVSIPLLIVFGIGLYWSLNKVVVPFVLKVASSDVFFETDAEQEELGKLNNDRARFAFNHCKSAMEQGNHVPQGSQFADADYEVWALGGKMYLTRSHVKVSSETGVADKKYACKIQFAGGDMTDVGNWSVLAVDFNPDTN